VSESQSRNSRQGAYVISTVAGEPVRAFVPPPLPPDDLQLDAFYQHLDRANRALGQLDGLSVMLPDARFLLYLFVRKEALLSSQIEGTQSSLTDLLLFENKVPTKIPKEDVEEVYLTDRRFEITQLPNSFLTPLALNPLAPVYCFRNA
jgi:hypothetical protein